MGDDIEAATRSGLLTHLKLIIKLRGPAQQQALLFRLNGATLIGGELL